MDAAVHELFERHADIVAELVHHLRRREQHRCRQQEWRAEREGCREGGRQLSPRATMTLLLLMDGLSEKQVAVALGITQNTAHVYVKELHKAYGVSSRAELLAKAYRERYDVREEPPP